VVVDSSAVSASRAVHLAGIKFRKEVKGME
jgi:hypothetical protein